MKTILILGSSGFLGGALFQIILEKAKFDQNKYIFVDNLTYTTEFYNERIEFHGFDIRDDKKLKSCLRNADVCVQVAALVGDPAGKLTPEVTEQINIERTKFIADNFNGKIIFCSSCSLYGINENICDESAPLEPISLYGKTKKVSEEILAANDKSLIFRWGTLFGISSFGRIRLDLLVNTLSCNAFYLKKQTIYGESQHRPLLHVLDAASLIFDELDTDSHGVYNVSLQNIKIGNLAYQVQNHFPDSEIEFKSIAPEDMRDYKVSSQKAKDELGFNPKYNIDYGINQLKTLFESGGLKDWKNPKYNNWNYLKEFKTHLNPLFPPKSGYLEPKL